MLPNTLSFTPLDILTAAELNDLVENTEALSDGSGIADGAITNANLDTTQGELGGAWQTWTPTYSGITVGNGTVTAKYTQIGKTVHFFWSLQLGSTTSVSNGNSLSAPVTASSAYNTAGTPMIGHAFAVDVGSTNHIGQVGLSDVDTLSPFWVNLAASGYGTVSSTFPINEAAGDVYTLSGTYEAA